MFDDSSHPLIRLLRHTASVPKGFLRYHVLGLLREKPVSGSEIMEEIEKQTGGRWKPSPGSVYPLLAWLQENGYTKEIPHEEGDVVKRYILTEKGVKFFEEESRIKEELQRRIEFFAPPFLSGLSFHPKKLRVIREPAGRFVRSLFDLRMALEGEITDQALEEVAEILNNSAEKIEGVIKSLKEARENR